MPGTLLPRIMQKTRQTGFLRRAPAPKGKEYAADIYRAAFAFSARAANASLS